MQKRLLDSSAEMYHPFPVSARISFQECSLKWEVRYHVIVLMRDRILKRSLECAVSLYVNRKEDCRQNFSNFSIEMLAIRFMYRYYKLSWLVSNCTEKGFYMFNTADHSASIPLYVQEPF